MITLGEAVECGGLKRVTYYIHFAVLLLIAKVNRDIERV